MQTALDVGHDYLAFVDEEMMREQEEATQSGVPFIDSVDKANWAVRKIAQAEARKRSRAATVAAEIERVTRWQQEGDAEDQRTIDFFTGMLAVYFDGLVKTGSLGKKKSLKLPTGTLQMRTSQPKLDFDKDALARWLRENGRTDLVRTVDVAEWGEFKKTLSVVPNPAGGWAVLETNGHTPIQNPDAETGGWLLVTEGGEIVGPARVVDVVRVVEPARETFSVSVASDLSG